MLAPRFAGALWLLTATLLQLGGINRLHIAGGAPNLALLTVLTLALVEGPAAGMTYGFAAGLLGDLLSIHTLGRLALIWTIVGFAVGMVGNERGRESRNPAAPMGLVLVGSLVATLAYAALAVAVGDPHAPVADLVRSAVVGSFYNLLLTPFLFPPLRALLLRLEPGAL